MSALFLSLWIAATVQPAGGKTAVIIFGATAADRSLGDNLTEVVVATAVQKGWASVGGAEFRAALPFEEPGKAEACLEDAVCAARAAVGLGATRIIWGSAGREKKEYLFHLALREMGGDGRVKRVFRQVSGSLEDLVRRLQDATDTLFKPTEEPGRLTVDAHAVRSRVFVDNVFVGLTPIAFDRMEPGRHRVRVEADGHFPWSSAVVVSARETLQLHLGATSLPVRRTWPAYVAWGGAAAAGVTTGAGVYLTVLANGTPNGHNRAEAMMNFERQRSLSRIGSGLLISSAVLAAISAYHFVRYRHDILGRAEDDDGP